jgi:hypothetical protein
MATTLRRIQRLEADFRRYHRELDQQELRKKYDRNAQISRKSLEYCEKQMDDVLEQMDCWKKVVAKHEDEGLKSGVRTTSRRARGSWLMAGLQS